jgi:hypothetical protein
VWYRKAKKTKRKVNAEGKTVRRKLEEMDFNELVEILDKEFSYWVRASHSNEDGTAVACYTCGHYHPINDIDAGHFISRSNYGLRWDPRNVKPQCKSENRFKNGVHDVFRARLVEQYGKEEVEKMEAYAAFYGKVRPPKEWLLEEIKSYRKRNAIFRERKRGLMY